MTVQGRGFGVQLKKFRIYWPTENTQQGLYALFPIRRNRTLVQANLTLYAKRMRAAACSLAHWLYCLDVQFSRNQSKIILSI